MSTNRYLAYFWVAIMVPVTAHAEFIETVFVGNPGNAGDALLDRLQGAVSYEYRIGKYEVTNAQYTEFLNSVDSSGMNVLGLYHFNMMHDVVGGINFNVGAPNGSRYAVKNGRARNPVNYVSWYDAARFANWLHNGQGSGDTESGAYTLLGGTPIPSNGPQILRNPGAIWFLPSEDEWHKAAYHKNDGVTANYWDYPTATDIIPYSDQPPGTDSPDPSNTANFYRDDSFANGYNDGYAVSGSSVSDTSQNYLTDVGAYAQAEGPYGTFDQAGNVWEWTDTRPKMFSTLIGLEGGGFTSRYFLLKEFNNSMPLGVADGSNGFRVTRIIPEPSTLTAAVLAFAGLLTGRARVRRAHHLPERNARSRTDSELVPAR